MAAKTPLQRFWQKVRRGPSWDCWEWTATTVRGGYSQFSYDGSLVPGHRFSYEAFIGPIPDGLVIDHLCRNRACVNPYHLEAVTDRENTLRGIGPAALHARKTHCDSGHEFTPENTYRRPHGRECRECARDACRKWRKKKALDRLEEVRRD